MSILVNKISKVMTKGIAAALAAATLISVPAQAKELAVVESPEIFAAYQAICLANPNDLDGQIATAKAAPYGFTLAEASEDGSQRFENPRLFAAMRKDEKNHFCMVGGRLAEGTSLETGAAAGAKALDQKGARMSTTPTMIMWSDIKVKPITIYMYTHTVKGPITIGSFLTGVQQGK